ncbi:mitochondrial transcription rescue factor 1 [Metopolophium dirhodum]|uniref:mitochondrial transcription rescue factor 1 n=1 Tax=Metopolophium dirhodum TaxID=44670 RepID=UPI00298FEB39|nr:mitochondrial transcription rescue factor 1 [Metopolophium dirhodum]
MMFNTLRFLSRLSSTAVPIGLRSSVLNRHSVRSICYQCRQPILANKFQCVNTGRRYKRTKKENDRDSDDELDLEMDESSQLIKFRTSTMRMDTVLKHALGKSRNKIEVAFYESRIRVNGEKVMKKSHSIEVGDEVDLVKGPSPNNPDFLLVSRVEVLSAELDGDELDVKLKKYKSLLINNYENKWKSQT